MKITARMMPAIVLGLLMILAGGLAPVKAGNTDATAMMYYADWCGPCQMLKPQLEEAVATYEAANVQVMYLDFTTMDFENIMIQADKADSIGMADQVTLTNVTTGYAVIVIDGVVRGRISAGMDVDLIHMMFDSALAQ